MRKAYACIGSELSDTRFSVTLINPFRRMISGAKPAFKLMKRLTLICALFALLAGSPAVLQTKPQTAATPTEQSQALVTSYCAGCHNSKMPKPAGGLALDTLNVQEAPAHPEVWGKSRSQIAWPADASSCKAAVSLSRKISTRSCELSRDDSRQSHNGAEERGHVRIQRLNRTE